MMNVCRRFTPILVVFVGLFFLGTGPLADMVDAKSRMGGKSFKSTPYKSPAPKAAPTAGKKSSGSFGRGLAGGLLGGALGGMLFGSMFGMGGQGMGLLPILLLGGVGYFLYRKFTQSRQAGHSGPSPHSGFPGQGGDFGPSAQNGPVYDAPPPPPGSSMALEDGFAEIRKTDPGFDTNYFLEVASDVFFQVQAGWMRRDLDSYRHLLGDQLASEYAGHFADMKAQGVINKLESIAIRKVDIQAAGSTGTEDFVTVLFTANLLDYTVNDTTGDLVEGSMTDPVKFREEWTWARPVGTNDWRLEGIHAPEK